MTLLADLVAASDAVAATSKRTEKVAVLAALLAELEPDEVDLAVGMLTGAPRQRRTGVAWRTVQSVAAEPAVHPSLAIADVDAALSALEACEGPGSQAERNRLLTRLLAASTDAEQWFLRRLLVGELRQGALAGVMNDAVAKASGAPLAVVRRAAMLSGDLAATACLALVEGVPGLEAVRLEVLRPVLPMLAASSPDVATALADAGGGEVVSVEWKLDGARIQVHRAGDRVGIWTRNLNEVTERLPGIVAGALAFPATSFVLDGEAMGFDDDERPGVFQETMATFGSQAGGAGNAIVRQPGGDRLGAVLPGLRRPAGLRLEAAAQRGDVERVVGAQSRGVGVARVGGQAEQPMDSLAHRRLPASRLEPQGVR